MEFSFLTALLVVAIIYFGWQFAKEALLLNYCREESPECTQKCITECLDDDIKCSEQCSRTCTHNVQCDYQDKAQAADVLHHLDNQSQKLANHLYDKYKDQKSDRGKLAKNLHKRYRGKSRLVETDPGNKDKDTAYVIDKGWLLSLCIRKDKDKSVSDFHKKNFLTFVLIHELAHIAANVDQHPKRFWEVFKWMLHEAKNNDPTNPIYTHINFKQDPVNYCGILNVTYTPEWDGDLKDIEGALQQENTTVKEEGFDSDYVANEYEKYGEMYDNIKF